MSAVNIVQSQGGLGKHLIVKYQLRATKFNDLDLLKSYIQENELSLAEILDFLQNEDIESTDAIQMLLDFAITQSRKAESELVSEDQEQRILDLHCKK